MSKHLSLLIENPDFVKTDDMCLFWSFADAYPFGIYDGKMYIEQCVTHDDMEPKGVQTYDYKFPGRLWKYYKVISFWVYPKSQSELQKVIKLINKKVKSFKIDDSWEIEIVADKAGKWAKNIKKVGNYLDPGYQNIIIPIKDYAYSAKRKSSEMGKSHRLSPLLKQLSKMNATDKLDFYKQQDMVKNKGMYGDNKAFQLALRRASYDPLLIKWYASKLNEIFDINYVWRIDKYLNKSKQLIW